MCQSRAEGGQRCAAHTRAAMASAQQAHTDAVFAASRTDQAVAAREDALGHELGLSPYDLPEHLYISDAALLAATCARRDAQDAQAAARRDLDQAVVEHAMTRTGRMDVAAWLADATDKGDVRKAARWANLLNQADDTVAYRQVRAARYGQHAGRAGAPAGVGAGSGAGRARHLVAVP